MTFKAMYIVSEDYFKEMKTKGQLESSQTTVSPAQIEPSLPQVPQASQPPQPTPPPPTPPPPPLPQPQTKTTTRDEEMVEGKDPLEDDDDFGPPPVGEPSTLINSINDDDVEERLAASTSNNKNQGDVDRTSINSSKTWLNKVDRKSSPITKSKEIRNIRQKKSMQPPSTPEGSVSSNECPVCHKTFKSARGVTSHRSSKNSTCKTDKSPQDADKSNSILGSDKGNDDNVEERLAASTSNNKNQGDVDRTSIISSKTNNKVDRKSSPITKSKEIRDIRQKKSICTICNAEFDSKKKLAEHIIKRHKGKKAFVCRICKKTFETDSGLNSHIKNHHFSRQVWKSKKQVNFIAQKRKRMETDVRDDERNPETVVKKLKEDVKSQDSQNLIKCKECNKIFESFKDFKQHQLTVHSGQRKRKNIEDQWFDKNGRQIQPKRVKLM